MSQQADGEMVLVSAVSANARAKKIYHPTRADCRMVARDDGTYREVARESLSDDWTCCQYCAGEFEQPGPSPTECPRCGETVTNLGQHLRNTCDGGAWR